MEIEIEILSGYYVKLASHSWMQQKKYLIFADKEAAVDFIVKKKGGGVKYELMEGWCLKQGDRLFKLKEVTWCDK